MRATRIAFCLLAVAGCSSTALGPSTTQPTRPARMAYAEAPAFEPGAEVAGAPAAAPAPAPAPTPPGNMTGGKEQGMGNCPAAVPGARTSMTFRDDGIELLVVSSVPESAKRIRSLAHMHAAMASPSGVKLHSGKHGGPGRIGYCPVIHVGATVTVTDAPGGARIRMAARSESEIVDLQELVALRVAGLPPVQPITPAPVPAATKPTTTPAP